MTAGLIIGTNGQPIENSLPVVMAGAQGGYRGGHRTRELMSWLPALRSADADLLPDHELLTARAHDTVRNFALVAGGVQAQLDNIVGSGLRLSAKPDWRALGQSVEWASEWSRKVESR